MPSLAHLTDILRDRGYRITAQREIILSAVTSTDDHMSAEEIYAKVQQQTTTIDIATIYRTLEMLVEEGLAYKTNLGTGEFMYATFQHGSHIHLICRKCSAVIDADHSVLAKLEKSLLADYGFRPDLQHISLFGLCDKHAGKETD